jgi:hypothetical protein
MTLEGFEQAPQIDRVRDDQGARIRAYPRAHRLEGAPHVVFKSQRGQLVEGSHQGSFRALGPQRKRFHGRVSGPRADPYRIEHGRPLELPDNSSTRNPQFATRSWELWMPHPSVPQRDGERVCEQDREHPPIASTRPGLGGSTRGYTSWICTERRRVSIRAHGTTEAG